MQKRQTEEKSPCTMQVMEAAEERCQLNGSNIEPKPRGVITPQEQMRGERALPTSLRPRSTSMTCSAHSFSSASSSASSAASSSGVRPRRRVPASGLQPIFHSAWGFSSIMYSAFLWCVADFCLFLCPSCLSLTQGHLLSQKGPPNRCILLALVRAL